MLTNQSAHRKDLSAGYAHMEHRHFATIAAIIRKYRNFDDVAADIAEHFADELGSTNPNFDRSRFLLACKAYVDTRDF